MFRYVRRMMLRKKHERESFNARIQMERNEQVRTAARLKAVEVSVSNQLRQKRLGSNNG